MLASSVSKDVKFEEQQARSFVQTIEQQTHTRYSERFHSKLLLNNDQQPCQNSLIITAGDPERKQAADYFQNKIPRYSALAFPRSTFSPKRTGDRVLTLYNLLYSTSIVCTYIVGTRGSMLIQTSFIDFILKTLTIYICFRVVVLVCLYFFLLFVITFFYM